MPIGKVFSGHDVDELMRVLKKAVRDGQSINTPPIKASVDGDKAGRYVHTVVPIVDATGSGVHSMFIYSERAE